MFASSTGRLMGESQELSLYFRGRTSAAYVFTRNVAPHARIYTKWISNEANKDVLSLQTPQYQNALHADTSCANRPLQLSFTAIPPPARPLSVWRYLCLILLVSPRLLGQIILRAGVLFSVCNFIMSVIPADCSSGETSFIASPVKGPAKITWGKTSRDVLSVCFAELLYNTSEIWISISLRESCWK